MESPPLLAGLCAASSCSLDTWTCQGLANLAWSLAKLERAENSLLERIITVLARSSAQSQLVGPIPIWVERVGTMLEGV